MNELDRKKHLEELDHIAEKILESSKYHRTNYTNLYANDLSASIGKVIEEILIIFSNKFNFDMNGDVTLIISVIGAVFSTFYKMYDNDKNRNQDPLEFVNSINKLFLYCVRG